MAKEKGIKMTFKELKVGAVFRTRKGAYYTKRESFLWADGVFTNALAFYPNIFGFCDVVFFKDDEIVYFIL